MRGAKVQPQHLCACGGAKLGPEMLQEADNRPPPRLLQSIHVGEGQKNQVQAAQKLQGNSERLVPIFIPSRRI